MTDETGPGYKNPPKATQFRPGTSGNPGGRPRGSRSILVELQEELLQEVTVGDVTLTKQALVARSLVNAAIKGNLRAIECVLRLNKNETEGTPESEASLTPAIEKYLARKNENQQENPRKDSENPK